MRAYLKPLILEHVVREVDIDGLVAACNHYASTPLEVRLPEWWRPCEEPDAHMQITRDIWHLVLDGVERGDALNLRVTCKFFCCVVTAHAPLWGRSLDQYRDDYYTTLHSRLSLSKKNRTLCMVRLQSRLNHVHEVLDRVFDMTVDLAVEDSHYKRLRRQFVGRKRQRK